MHVSRELKVKDQGHLRARSYFTIYAAKILYGCFGGTTDTLCVTTGKIFIIYCSKIVKLAPIEVGCEVKMLFSFLSKMNLNYHQTVFMLLLGLLSA